MITDLVHNAIEADAAQITLIMEENRSKLHVVIADDGAGMSDEILAKARDPFWSDGRKHRHRKVGLGLPFLYQTAELTGGNVEVESALGTGTTVRFTLDRQHVDLPAFGNFVSAATTLLTYTTGTNLTIDRSVKEKRYTVSSRDLVEVLGDLNDTANLSMLKAYIRENENQIGSTSDESDGCMNPSNR